MFGRKRKESAPGFADDSVETTVAENPLTQRTLQMLGITVLLSQLPLLLHLPLWLTLPGMGLVLSLIHI